MGRGDQMGRGNYAILPPSHFLPCELPEPGKLPRYLSSSCRQIKPGGGVAGLQDADAAIIAASPVALSIGMSSSGLAAVPVSGERAGNSNWSAKSPRSTSATGGGTAPSPKVRPSLLRTSMSLDELRWKSPMSKLSASPPNVNKRWVAPSEMLIPPVSASFTNHPPPCQHKMGGTI